MNNTKISKKGERAALGGYMPQFDFFAKKAYSELVNENLEWIRVADPEAGKLDDIQYATKLEIHAYQVKWTIIGKTISYNDFKKLLPSICESWKGIKLSQRATNKRVIPHLLTNKKLSKNDTIKVKDIKIGNVVDFYQVLQAWKQNTTYDSKWDSIFNELQIDSKLSPDEFSEFLNVLVFSPAVDAPEIKVTETVNDHRQDDLVRFSRLIKEKVADAKAPIEFTKDDIIRLLAWGSRVKSNFNHELVVDLSRYQPIKFTIQELDEQLSTHSGGYIFLEGGPGSGKSTLLTECARKWSKNSQVIKYYAFDFNTPSSMLNTSERGERESLFFDLVLQLRRLGIYSESSLPSKKDSIELKKIFERQLSELAQKFQDEGKSTIIIIDGLDHIPREYTDVNHSFLNHLPKPDSISDGIYIILGSQSYELKDLQTGLKKHYKSGERTIKISPLTKQNVANYIDKSIIGINNEQKTLIYQKSEGHPLYLSYIIEQIKYTNDVDEAIDSFVTVAGEIDNYYEKLWQPIAEKTEGIQEILGLLARIEGDVPLDFIKEWNFKRESLSEVRKFAKHLFNTDSNSWSFFHNSFRQFLLIKTANDPLTESYDPSEELKYHSKLADFYKHSKVVEDWNRYYHLFEAKRYDEFIQELTPDVFTEQLLAFRPISLILGEVKRAIKVAHYKKDALLLIKYLFTWMEFDNRVNHIENIYFENYLLKLGKIGAAKKCIRIGNKLECDPNYALKLARKFLEVGDEKEAAFLFNLSYPSQVQHNKINIDEGYIDYVDHEMIESLSEWIYTAPYFLPISDLLDLVDKITIVGENTNKKHKEEANIRRELLENLCESLIESERWDDLELCFSKFPVENKDLKSLFFIYHRAIHALLELQDSSRARSYLDSIRSIYEQTKTDLNTKIYIADLIYKVTQSIDESYEWIKDIQQPITITKDDHFYGRSLSNFAPLIRLNKLLNLKGLGVSIVDAIPTESKDKNELLSVEFRRKLLLITQLYSIGLQKQVLDSPLIKRVRPIISFYYKQDTVQYQKWYHYSQLRPSYFEFLIDAVALLGKDALDELGNHLFAEFENNPSIYYPSNTQRAIIKTLRKHNYNLDKSINQAFEIQRSMLNDRDISGKVEECLEQVDLWIILDKPEFAKEWLTRAVEVSLGIGYRKDYQLSTWIKWIDIAQLDKLEKVQFVDWLLPHLLHIKETTEGRAYWEASDQLLGVAFECDFYAGFSQMKWQLKKGLIDFDSAVAIFIEAYLNRTKTKDEYRYIFQFYIQFYLQITNSEYLVLEQVLNKGYEINGEDFFHYLSSLINTIRIKLLEQLRSSCYATIHSFAKEKAIDIEAIYPDFLTLWTQDDKKKKQSQNKLTLSPDYQQLFESEVLQKVKDFESLMALLEQEDKGNSRFDWRPVIDGLKDNLTQEQLELLSNFKFVESRGVNVYIKLSQVAIDHGNNELAQRFAKKALSTSSEWGWDKYYDGGTRIKAFQRIQAVVDESHDSAFDAFIEDTLRGDINVRVTLHLEEIAPLIMKNYDPKSVWNIMYDYLKRLMSNSTPTENTPKLEFTDKSIMETLVDFLFFLYDYPIPVIRERISKLFVIGIQNELSVVIDKLNTINKPSRIELELLDDVFMALKDFDLTALQLFLPKIRFLAVNKDYRIRKNAQLILTLMQEQIPVPIPLDCSPIFDLELPFIQELNYGIDEKSYPKDIDKLSFQRLLTPFSGLLKYLSDASNIPHQNLISRLKIISSKEYDYNIKEKEIILNLEEIGLKYSWLRPKTRRIQHAVMQLITELIDSDRIAENPNLNMLTAKREHRTYYWMEHLKPKFIQTLKQPKYNTGDLKWCEKAATSARINETELSLSDNYYVIGESSMVKLLKWSCPTEYFMQQLSFTDILELEYDFIYGQVFQCLVHQYYETELESPHLIIINDHRYGNTAIKSRWIAINPSIARYLGWLPSPDHLFGWQDKHGDLVAESIFWTNGNVDMFHQLPNNEVGEGWIVRVSLNGLKQLQGIGELFIHKHIIRRKGDEIKDYSKVEALTTYTLK